ncbi:MAG: alpha/beta fold hydrolase [Pseudomonadota bacterium]|nr:alpha/beta fold hydrolase [Pseudomonadota bacterium]
MLWYRIKVTALGIALILLAVSVVKLKEAETGLNTVRMVIDDTPVVITEPRDSNDVVVFLAHGFAGSTSFMRSIAVALAKSGYITVRFDFLGHGRHELPYSGDITLTSGATRIFVDQTEMIVEKFIKDRAVSKGVIIGHSMASDIIFRTALTNNSLVSAIGISTYTDVITKTDPKNVFIINGLWEPKLRRKAIEIFQGLGIEMPEEDYVYGSFADGTARKITTIKNADHVGILFSTRTQEEIIEWINSVLKFDSGAEPNEIGVWVTVLFVSLIFLFIICTSYLPKNRAVKLEISKKRIIIGNLLALTLTPIVLLTYTPPILSYAAHNYLLVHLVLYSIILCWALKLHENKNLSKNFNMLLCVSLFVFFSLILGALLDNYVSSFYPTGPRVGLFCILLIGCIPIMITIQFIYDTKEQGTIIANLSKLILIISFLPALIFNFKELFLLFYIIVLFIAFFMVFGFLSNILHRRYNNMLSVGIANGGALSWTFSTALPLYVL